jgi:putative phosphoesterase
MFIGVLSDTHVRVPGTRAGLSSLTAENLPVQIRDVFRGVDLIMHAGDIYTLPVLDMLETIAPVMASEGDDDPFEVVNDRRVRHEQILEVGKITIWMSHYGLYPEHMLGKMPDVAIYGHSHTNLLEKRNGTLWLNPGSPTFPKYQHVPGTVALLSINDGTVEAKLVQLEGDLGGSITSGGPGRFS